MSEFKRSHSQAFDQDGQQHFEDSHEPEEMSQMPQGTPGASIADTIPDICTAEIIPAGEDELLDAYGLIMVGDQKPGEMGESMAENLVNMNDKDMNFLYDQIQKIQQVLHSMQETIPRNKYTSKISDDIESMLVEVTILLSAGVPAEGDDVEACRNNMRKIMLDYRALKTIYDDVTYKPTPVLRRRPTDATDNEDDDDNNEGKLDDQSD